MRELTKKEHILYETLKKVEKEISKDELIKKLGWTEQKFLDVSCPIAKDFRDFNAGNVIKLSSMIAYKNEQERIQYFQNHLIDCALQLESKLIELNRRQQFRDKQYQFYIKLWKKYRGY